MVASIVNGEPATWLSAPPALTENIDTVALDELAIASSPLVGLNASASGVAPSANGEPVTCVSAPFAATENIDTVLSLKLAVASSPPFELNDIAFRPLLAPVANGEPGTWVSAPAALTENTDTVLSALAVASSPPLGLNAIESGPPPVANGEPVTCVSAPSAATENTDTVLVGLVAEVTRLAVASSLSLGLNATESGKAPVVNVEPGTGANAGTPGVAAAEPENTLTDRPTSPTQPRSTPDQSAASTARHTPRPATGNASIRPRDVDVDPGRAPQPPPPRHPSNDQPKVGGVASQSTSTPTNPK